MTDKVEEGKQIMNNVITPTLSTQMWLTTPEVVIDNILVNYISANPSQSLLFKGNVLSLQNSIYLNNDDPEGLIIKVEADLVNIYGQHSDNVTIDVTYAEVDGRIDLTISGSIEMGNKNHDLNKIVTDSTSLFSNIVNNT